MSAFSGEAQPRHRRETGLTMLGCRRQGMSLAICLLVIATALPGRAEGQMFRRVLNILRPPLPAKVEAEKAEEADGDEEPRSVVLPDNGDMSRKLVQVRLQIEGRKIAYSARLLGTFSQVPHVTTFFHYPTLF